MGSFSVCDGRINIRTSHTHQVIFCYVDGMGRDVKQIAAKRRRGRTDEQTKANEGGIHKHILKGAEYGLSGYCGLQYDERERETESE